MKANQDFIKELAGPDWAATEFDQAPLVDRRLNRRLSALAGDLARQPGASIAQACQTDAQIRGAYRFLENDFVEPEQILLGHRQAGLQRLAREPVVLLPQDTTSFNFSHRAGTTGLGPIGTKERPEARGLWLHSTQAFTPPGVPLGLVTAHFWSRPETASADGRDRHQKSFEEKESVRWRESWESCQAVRAQMPATSLWVNIADMEGDVYEVFAAVLAQPAPRVEVLVRSRHNRQVVADGERLWERLARQPLADVLEVRVPRRNGQPARLVRLEIRFCEVRLEAPERKAGQPPLDLWAVEAREPRPPKGIEPIRWRLLTTLPVTTAAAAIEQVRWYARRWGVEVFHKIVKSVCRAEARQLETSARLQRVLMIDLVIAWRIQVLTQVGRQNPDLPATDYFTQAEWEVLYLFVHRHDSFPAQAPSLGQMVDWIGRLGGFLKSKANPHPGPITLARGLARLNDMAAIWAIQNANKTNANKSSVQC
jgi:Transposase DNA-binding/Transposase Tn5 dimerisation domain